MNSTDRFEQRVVPPSADRPKSTVSDASALEQNYEDSAAQHYAYLPDDVRRIFIDDAIYHKARYLELLSRPYGERVLELGSDKPFISHFLRTLHPTSTFDTVSIDIPYSPYPIVRVDIESQQLPFESGSFSDVIFTEVLEHLFRDPAWALAEMNRTMQMGGTLFCTTPNACGYDSLINFANQTNPNARSQFYAAIESGHPHLWTGDECRELFEAHGFEIVSIDTADYVPIPIPEALSAFIQQQCAAPDLHGQSLRIVARKSRFVDGPVYPTRIFPEGMPVQLRGALREWAATELTKS